MCQTGVEAERTFPTPRLPTIQLEPTLSRSRISEELRAGRRFNELAIIPSCGLPDLTCFAESNTPRL
jgi:hypothetical protein